MTALLRAAAAAVRRRVKIRLKTHNLHDTAGRPTMRADVAMFTEAAADRVRERLGGRVGRAWRKVLVCQQQRSLVIVVNRLLFDVERTAYRRAHGGLERVTPARGTFVVLARVRFTKIRVALVAEHRINAAFDDVRGELAFRWDCWRQHQKLTLDWIDELERDGRVVLAGGDPNTPADVRAYDGRLWEPGGGKDRIACSRGPVLDRHEADPSRVDERGIGPVVELRAHLTDFKVGPRRGSDHHENSGVVTVTTRERKAAA